MGPAQTMGTFLRVWRSQWAGLSRAQLAAALRGVSPKAHGVTEDVVRRWEGGQPPSTTEELDALLKVMRAHGLMDWEVDQFRKALFAACLDRQYPGLASDGGFAHRPDVDQIACSVWAQPFPTGHLSNAPVCVAWVTELQAAIRSHARPPARGSQEWKQEVALSYLQRALAGNHMSMGRFALHASACADERRWMLSRPPEFWEGAFCLEKWADWSLVFYRSALSFSAGSPDPMWEVLEVQRDALERGEVRWATEVLGQVVCVAYSFQPDDGEPLRRAVRPMAREHLAMLADVAPYGLDATHLFYADLAIKDGDFGEAQEHLAAADHCRDGGAGQLNWLGVAGGFLAATGSHGEARTCYERGLGLAKEKGIGVSVMAFSYALEKLG